MNHQDHRNGRRGVDRGGKAGSIDVLLPPNTHKDTAWCNGSIVLEACYVNGYVYLRFDESESSGFAFLSQNESMMSMIEGYSAAWPRAYSLSASRGV